VIEPLSPQVLAWVRQSAAVGLVTSQALLHLLERLEALEARLISGAVELAADLSTLDAKAWAYIGKQSICGDPATTALIDLLNKPPAPQPAPEAAPVAAQPNHEVNEYTDQEWAEINRWRQESTDLQPAQPTPPPAPAGGLVEMLVEMVVAATWEAEELAGEEYERAAIARVAIRYVAAWLDLQGQHGCSLLLREEANR